MHEGSDIKINGVVIGKVKSASFDKVPEPIINLRDAVDYVPQQPVETTLSVTRFAVTETAFTPEILREALERVAEEDGYVLLPRQY